MLLVDDLLLLPFSGFRFILRTLEKVAEDEYTNQAPVKERLLELELKRESGEVSEEDYVREEAAILRELREIENRKRALAGAPSTDEDRGFAYTAQNVKASAAVTWHRDSERKE